MWTRAGKLEEHGFVMTKSTASLLLGMKHLPSVAVQVVEIFDGIQLDAAYCGEREFG